MHHKNHANAFSETHKDNMFATTEACDQ